MGSKKKKLRKVMEETINTLHEHFGNRITSATWHRVPSGWISPHSEAVIIVEVKRENPELINTLYDVVYKEMFSRNFDTIISLVIKEYDKKEIKDENLPQKEVALWKAG